MAPRRKRASPAAEAEPKRKSARVSEEERRRSPDHGGQRTDRSHKADAVAAAATKKSAAAAAKKSSGSTKGPREPYTFWLMKSEPESRFENGVDMKFGIEDLAALPNRMSCWDGVRNYQARNFMRAMKTGQMAFFYHSNCKVPGIAGLVKIVKEAYTDHTQFDPKDAHYDHSSKKSSPKWDMVDVQFERRTKRFLPLAELKEWHLKHASEGGPLCSIALFTSARLSVQPLTKEEFDFVLSLEDEEPI
ncbi:thymocyte nuclear protein 1 isoform X1 [Petromyzon marinus]|uniref:thymocyte nuclear protein 1 isoform X1 n=1 Tax=Petromyzon marinus TaxID=7757 RepID=UPI003F6F5EDA